MRKFGIIDAIMDNDQEAIYLLLTLIYRAVNANCICWTGFNYLLLTDSASSTMPIENLYIARVIDGLILVCRIRVS